MAAVNRNLQFCILLYSKHFCELWFWPMVLDPCLCALQSYTWSTVHTTTHYVWKILLILLYNCVNFDGAR